MLLGKLSQCFIDDNKSFSDTNAVVDDCFFSLAFPCKSWTQVGFKRKSGKYIGVWAASQGLIKII